MLYCFGNKAPLILSFMKSQICKVTSTVYMLRIQVNHCCDGYSLQTCDCKFWNAPKSKSNIKTHMYINACLHWVFWWSQVSDAWVWMSSFCTLFFFFFFKSLFRNQCWHQVWSYGRVGGHNFFNKPVRFFNDFRHIPTEPVLICLWHSFINDHIFVIC